LTFAQIFGSLAQERNNTNAQREKIFEKAKQEVHRTVSFAKTARGSGSVVFEFLIEITKPT
jgi:hypothetical protein